MVNQPEFAYAYSMHLKSAFCLFVLRSAVCSEISLFSSGAVALLVTASSRACLTGAIHRSFDGDFFVFWSPVQHSWPNKAGLKCLYVRLSTKSVFDFYEIWHVGIGRLVLYAGGTMQYDLIQGEGHEPYKVGNLAIFKIYLLPHLQWEPATDLSFLN